MRPIPGSDCCRSNDALLLAYDPKARDRFADERVIAASWNRANGVHAPTVLLDGRIRGCWRLERTGRSAVVVVEAFAWERRIDEGELEEPVRAIGLALDLAIDEIRTSRRDPRRGSGVP